MTMSDELVLTEQPADGSLPAPKPAAAHVAIGVDVLPRALEDRSDEGVPHPAHRAP